MDKFLQQNIHKIFYLMGYAGTGKTFLISKIIGELLSSNKIDQVYVCAPTHQALGIIESFIRADISGSNHESSKISFMTIHKLLEFKPVIMPSDGEKVFMSSRESKFIKKFENKLIVIDECSMISKSMEAEINKYINLYPIRVIYMGDPNQLPPVHEKESVVFSKITKTYPFHIQLNEIMRTKSVDIKQVCTIIRNWDQKASLAKLFLPIHDKKIIAPQIRTFQLFHKKTNHLESSWFKFFLKCLKNDKIPIILTWQNTTADYYNQIIRKHIHKTSDIQNYVVGDCAMFNNFYAVIDEKSVEHKQESRHLDGESKSLPIKSGNNKNHEKSQSSTSGDNKNDDDKSNQIICRFYTSDLVKIKKVTTKKKKLVDWKSYIIKDAKTVIDQAYNRVIKKLSQLKNKYQVDYLIVDKHRSNIENSGFETDIEIKTISRCDIKEHQELLKVTKEHVMYFNTKYKSDRHALKLWEIYHKKLREPFAEINFGYSITIYKSQGSTFDTVFIDIDDVNMVKDPQDVQKALYTSAGRASKMLGFLM